MNARRLGHTRSLALLLGMLPSLAQANGRMPGANDMLLDPHDAQRLVLRASYGVVQSFDGGKTWQWICEQVIGTSGVIADPPTAVVADGTIVLLPPTGGALLSKDRGCSWVDAPAPLAAQRGVDLTVDPSDSARLLVLMSTLEKLDDAGFGVYRNLLIETRDSGRSWTLLSEMPQDFEAETVEVAAADEARIYVSGTASKNPRLGIIHRSDDGAASWTQSMHDLPAGTGSLLISAIHPGDADRLWLRVPARGDTIGVLPARLYVSSDKGQSMRMIASTQRGMFGFALSPDGSQLAYGGPSDGLYIGAADGGGMISKVNTLGVRCLRWTKAGDLYACGTEPGNAFSLGRSRDGGANFEKLYALAETCPQACAAETTSGICQDAWVKMTKPLLRATNEMCEVPADMPPADAGNAEPTEAGSSENDASERHRARPKESDCSCHIGPGARDDVHYGFLLLAAAVLARGRRRDRRAA